MRLANLSIIEEANYTRNTLDGTLNEGGEVEGMNTVGSLFSGIGGLELGLERTGGFKTIWNCEVDDYANAVLRKHWPDVPNLGDITKVDWSKVEKPDLICGGFPCQDISIAGKGKGIHGARSGLWAEFHRAIKASKPTWVIIENSPELIKLGLGQVLHDLRDAGYQSLRPLLLRASEVGAQQRRERIFVIAHINMLGCEPLRSVRERGQFQANQEWDVEEVSEGRQGKRKPDAAETDEDAFSSTNTDSFIRQWNVAQEVYRLSAFAQEHGAGGTEDVRGRRYLHKPIVGRGIYGLSRGMDRIKCLGNAVVPQVAEVVGRQILEMEANL